MTTISGDINRNPGIFAVGYRDDEGEREFLSRDGYLIQCILKRRRRAAASSLPASFFFAPRRERSGRGFREVRISLRADEVFAFAVRGF